MSTIEPPIPQELKVRPLTDYLLDAHRNVVVSMINMRREYDELSRLDNVFRVANDSTSPSQEPVVDMMFFRCHTAFLGATSMVLSGQLSNAYALSRAALECALYAAYMTGDVARQIVWINRHNDIQTLKESRATFQYGSAKQHLETINANLAEIAHALYQDAIDNGAHPNPNASFSQINVSTNGPIHQFEANYFVFDSPQFPLCLKATIQTAICALSIFEIICQKEFQITGADLLLADVRTRH